MITAIALGLLGAIIVVLALLLAPYIEDARIERRRKKRAGWLR